jgi:CRP-like cAMP-binding protein
MAASEQEIYESSLDIQNDTASRAIQDANDQSLLTSENVGEIDQSHELHFQHISTEGSPLRVASPLFAQSVRDKDRLAVFRASNKELKAQRRASLKAAIDSNTQKDAELQDIKRKGLDGNSSHIFAQLKKEKTEISMQVVDHSTERLKRGGKKVIGTKADQFYQSVVLATQASRLPELQLACWEVTNFVPLKIHNFQQSAATQASHQPGLVREQTEDSTVLKALRNLFNLLDVFSDQSEQFLTMLCKDTEVAVVTVPAGVRAATKSQPMTRSLVLLSGQAHKLSYAGESYILLEESQSTRMNIGDCLGFIDDNEDAIQENAFTIACQTSCSFLEITKFSFDEIYNHIKFERFMGIMHMTPEDRSDAELAFLCNFAKKNAFFKQLKESRQLNLCRQAKMEQWKFDDVLFNEDDRGQTYYIIIRGSVRVLKNVGGALDNQGNKIFQQVALLGQGVGFGELALLSSSGVRQATVIANENSVFMTLSRKTYNEVLRSEHEHSLNETIRAIVHVFPYVGQRDKIFQTYMAQLFREEELPAGHVVVSQGAKASTFYILKEGALSIDCRVDFSRFSPPEEAGFGQTESNFETKILKKFSEKEYKARVVSFGALSSFGDTIGDLDMLANPIWTATYMYKATVSKPAVLCSISWAALKVRFPPEMLEDLQSRSLKKYTLFRRIFNSAVSTECSNSKFCCLSDFIPNGYVKKNTTDEIIKSNVKMSLGEQLEEKKMKLRRNVRNRMDVSPMDAFQTTVNEWIVDMRHDNVLRSIETITEDMKKSTGVQPDALEALLLCETARKDSALQSVMRSAFLDGANIDFCIDNIIKSTSNAVELEETMPSVASHRLSLKSAESSVTSPMSGRTTGTPIPGRKPQFFRYDLTEQYCSVLEESMAKKSDFILLDSSIVETRPSSRATVLTSSSKKRQNVSSRQKFHFSMDTSGDEGDDHRIQASPTHDAYSSDASAEPVFRTTQSQVQDAEIPEYFYPDHYRIKTLKTKGAKNRATDFRKNREIKLRTQSASAHSFEAEVLATPIKLKPLNYTAELSISREIMMKYPVMDSNPPLPPVDKAILHVQSFQNYPLPQTQNRRINRNGPKVSQSALDDDQNLFLSIGSPTATKNTKAMGTFVREKKSQRSSDSSEFAVFNHEFSDDDKICGTTCSPDVVASSIVPEVKETEERPVSRAEKINQILKSGFAVAQKTDEETQKIQAEELERLKQEHAQMEKDKLRSQTKAKIADLFATGLLDHKIKHLQQDDNSKPIHFELSSTLMEKMNDVVVRRMNDPNFKTDKFAIKLSTSGIARAENFKKKTPAAVPKVFDFDGFDPIFSGRSMKFDDVTRNSYHNEQMLKIQNRNSDQQKTERQQLIKNVLSKTNAGHSIRALHMGNFALPAVFSASPKQKMR